MNKFLIATLCMSGVMIQPVALAQNPEYNIVNNGIAKHQSITSYFFGRSEPDSPEMPDTKSILKSRAVPGCATCHR